ncbi:hypothetical protein LSH36_1g18071 [Paralvinella palmiformis]|uniref:Cell division cycle protein 123 homolog n=1 Tax=Paralvinella palmiformis TaxID=53620 RepID=A0AAD9KHL4_9ANNE|nr:hypothetical protein LSH36_1g18071 [Paralvinella palmiformis]
MKRADVLQCQFSNWHNVFRDITFKSRVIDLPSDVTEYLLADGFTLPEGCEDKLQRTGLQNDSNDEVEWDSDKTEVKGPDFSQFNQQIDLAIESLGGAVFPKLNWSAPKDAVWIAMGNTLKCTCPRHIYLLLKSSNFISHDLNYPFDKCVDEPKSHHDIVYQLVLKRWHDINPVGEFRCFVSNNTLIGKCNDSPCICQRQHTSHFPAIHSDKRSICDDIEVFFVDNIQSKFPLSSYVFDVYRLRQNKVYLVDFNPYGPVTDGLLFSWDELLCDKPLGFDFTSQAPIKPVFRFVESEGQIQSNTYQCYAVPQDIVHLTTGEDPIKLIDFLKLKTQNPDDSSTDED